MDKTRMEAFSDGVIAILITIMVLELRAPPEASPAALRPLLPVVLSYALSFLFLAIYWSNHHHLLQAVEHVNGLVLWANLHLLFWLSLFPFATAWAGAHPLAPWPTALYGLVLFLAAVAYVLLTRALVGLHGRASLLAAAIGSDTKGKVSLLAYLAAVLAAFKAPWVSTVIYFLVAVVWLIPERRIEKRMVPEEEGDQRE